MAKKTSKKVGKLTMLDVWNYFIKLKEVNNNYYARGNWGQFNAAGKQCFDCVNAIKACGWGVPINVDITANQYDYIADNKATMPDVSINYFYNNAARKGVMANLPADIITHLYSSDLGHIGMYNPSTKEVAEMCAGSVMGIRVAKLSSYSADYWTKWTNGYYFTDSEVKAEEEEEKEDYNENTTPNRFKVKVNGTQVGAYTVYSNAVRKADTVGGVIVDGNNGEVIYTAANNVSTPSVSTRPALIGYETYTVKSGDSLWGIAVRMLGNGNRYKEIAELNGISAPYIIYPNQILRIPM